MTSIEQAEHDRKPRHRHLTEAEAKRLLASGGVVVPDFRIVSSTDEAAEAATALGFPVAVKVASPDILHKSDVGGVVLNVDSEERARQAFTQVLRSARQARPDARIEEALVERMCPPNGVEVIVGLVRDPLFGPIVMFGLGGVFVEVLKDVSFRAAPISRADAREMLTELRGARILEGVRGRPPIDRDALVNLLLVVAGPDGLANCRDGEVIAELDLNPVLAYSSGAMVADARITLAPETKAETQPIDTVDLRHTMRVAFHPHSIAVIGASATDEQQLGYRALRNLVQFGYEGSLYPIHPRAAEICGRRAYPSLADVPGPVERAIVTVAKDAVPEVVEQCAAKGVRVVHIYTAGFSELNEAGRSLEREILSRAQGSQLRILGPNCIGTYVPASHITPIVGAVRESGHLSLVTQSGSVLYDLVRRGCNRGLRFSKAISIGNSIDLDPNDFLEYFIEDPDTNLIALYVEAVHDGQRLRTALETALRRQKPMVVLKGGQTASGQRAAASHTGALASDYTIWDSLFRQFGVVAVQTTEEFVDTLLAFQMLPPMLGPAVSLIGPGGGVGVTATDTAERNGLTVAKFSPQTVAALEGLRLPPGPSLSNPLDLPAQVLRLQHGQVLGKALSNIVADPNTHALVVHLGLVSISSIAPTEVITRWVANMVSAVIALKSQTDRPICLVIRSTGEAEQDEIARTERYRALASGIPVYSSTEEALKALGHLYQYHQFLRHLATRACATQ